MRFVLIIGVAVAAGLAGPARAQENNYETCIAALSEAYALRVRVSRQVDQLDGRLAARNPSPDYMAARRQARETIRAISRQTRELTDALEVACDALAREQ